MIDRPTVPCKWCSKPTTMLGTQQCDGCWELSSRIAAQPALAQRMLDKLSKPNPADPLYKQAFPDYDDFPLCAAIMQSALEPTDTSWHNDSCPSFHFRSRMASVYADYLDPNNREEPTNTSRFTIVRTNPRGEYVSEPNAHHYRDCDTWLEATEEIAKLRHYNEQELDRIEQLFDGIEDGQIKMAVVDYLGMVDADGMIFANDLERRFGVRDLRHVEIYKLHVIQLNRKAREAL